MKKVLITGAAKGIGKELVKVFHKVRKRVRYKSY